MTESTGSVRRVVDAAVELSVWPSRIRSIGLIAAVAASFILQAPTPAQAAALWSQHAHTLGTHVSTTASNPGTDPAYEPKPAANGRNYTSPNPAASPKSSSGSGIEKLNLRTRTSRTYAGSGRQLTTLIYSQSVNFRDAGGTWQAIDDSLVKTSLAGYAHQNKSNRFTVYLPTDIGATPVRVQIGSSWFTFSLNGATGAAHISGSVADYANVLPGVSLVIAVQPDAVEESLVLSGPKAGSDFTYTIRTSAELDVVARGASLAIVDGTGRAVFTFAAPAMFDSSKPQAAQSSSIALTAVKAPSGTTATLKADPAWLNSSARKWPVTIDPTVIVGDVQDCYLAAASPTTSFCGGSSINAGFDGTNASRALLQFNLQSIPTTNTVVSAKLLMFLGSASTSTATSLGAYQLTGTWTMGATWNTYDGINSWTTAGGDFSGTAAATTNGIASTGVWYSWSPTALVQGWVNGTIANDGLLLKEPTENVTNVLAFNAATGTNPPYLQVVHQQGGPTPGAYSTTVTGDSPSAYWRMNETSGTAMVDAQGADSGTYQGGFTLAQGSLIQPASGTSVTFNGSTGYATASTLSTLQGDNTRSVELWFQTTNNGGEPLFDSGNAGANYQSFNLQLTGQGTTSGNPPAPNSPGIFMQLWNEDFYLPGLYLADGKRHQVVAELSGNSLWVYVDDTLPGGYLYNGGWNTRYLLSQPFSLANTPNTTGNAILVGNTRFNAGGATNFFQGQFDEVAVYPTALSATQVQNHWQAGNGLPWSPTSVSATPGTNQVALSWTAPSFNGSGITGYVVTPQVGSNLRTPITFNSSATSQTITNLSGGTGYMFTVSAFNSLGVGVPSNLSSSATPTGAAIPLYEDTVLADSPVGFWPLGETSGNVATDLTQTYNAQDFGGYAQGDAGPGVRFSNRALNLSGSNAYVRLNHATLLEPAVVTVELWIKPSSVPTNDAVIVMSPQSGNDDNSSNGYDLVFGGANGFHPGKVTFNGAGNLTTGSIALNVWSYIVGTSDGTSMRLYVNGTQVAAGLAGGPNYGGAPNFDALISRFGLPGDVADLAIYSSALSVAQIGSHYAAAGYSPGPITNLVATASTNSASLTWTTPSYAGTSPISFYSLTPVVDGKASTTITVSGNGTGANIANLPAGASYAFQVQASNASGTGVQVTSSAVTINSPGSGPGLFGQYLLLRGGPNDVQAWAHYGIVSRNNVPAMNTWTLEERLWGLNSMSTNGGHASIGVLSGTPSNPNDQSPVAGLYFDLSGTKGYFVWPGGGSCQIAPPDNQGIPLAFDGPTTTPAHVALTYDGTNIRGFINGSMVCGPVAASAALPAAPFGYMDNSGLNQAYFDEFRVSNVARWTNSFTPPTQQYTTDGNTLVLWHFNDYPISKLRTTHILARTGDDGTGYPITIIPSTYRDFSGNLNHANTIWQSGGSGNLGDDDSRRPYSLGQGVTADELVGGVSPWLCPCTANGGDPVNTATGEFSETFVDFNTPGRLPLSFTHTYSSLRVSYPLQPTKYGSVGYGWTDNYNEYLSFDGANGTGNATVHATNGSAVLFTLSNSIYSPPPSEHVSLIKNGDNTLTLTDKMHDQAIFSVAVNDPGGNTSTSTLAKLVDRHGYQTVLTPNADGTIQKVTDPAGRTLTFGYTTIGTSKFIQTITDTASPARTVSLQYGINSGDATTYQSLTQVTDVSGGLTKFTYDSSHYLLTVTDPSSGITTNTYDPGSHQITTQKDPMNRITTFGYSGGITSVTDPMNNVIQYEYLNNILVSCVRAPSTTQAVSTTFAYDPLALGETAVVGPNGQSATATRDPNDNALTTTDSMGRITANTYNSFSETLTKQDPLQVTTTTTYTSTGDIATTSRPLIGTQQIQTTTWTYGDAQHPGDATSMTDPDNHVWTYTYDTYGNQTAVTDPLGDKTTHAFDGVGRMTSMVTPNGNVSGGHPANFTWSYTFDAFGNRLTVTDPLSHKVTYRYDANQNLTQTTDPDNNVTTTVYDADNEPTQSKRADSPQTTVLTDYNADGTVLDEKDGKGNPILTFGYNALAQRTSRTDVLGNITTYTYDGVGNLITKQDPGGNCLASPPTSCTTYLYDSANQITAVTYSDGVTPNVTVKYDSGGQRTSETDGTGTSFWSWDSLHRPVSYTNGNGAQVQWIYNLRDLPLTITYPGSLNVTEVYDNAGRWTSVTDWTSNTTTFGYDANSNLTKETFPTTSGVIDTLTFNNADHMTAVSSKKGNSTLFSATYTRDAANQLTGDTSAASGTSKYKYDALNQVCYAGSTNTNACSTPPTGSIAYKYDAADNLTQNGSTQQQSFNNADELCWTSSTSGSCSSPPSGSSTYQYDLRGNRTSFNPNAGQAQTFTFDQAGHLASFTVGSSTTTYGYNSDGLRLCKVAGSSSAPCASQSADQFVWDTVDGDIVKDGSTLYVYGPGNLPVEQINGSTTYYFHHDQIGSTRLITTSAGASQATYTFNPYGKLVASTGSATNPFLFAGQFQDSESLNYYLRARYYDPTTGQFLSRDPATASTREPYGYVSDSPLNGTDPSGLDAYPCIEHIGPFPIIGICQGQQPGGGQFPIHAQPQPSPSPEPSPTPVQLRDCGCQVELRPMGAGEPALNLVVSNAGEEIDWVDFQVIGGGPVGTLNAREWIISGRMLGEGNFAATTVDTAGWGSGLFFAMAVATVTLVDGEKCLPAESLTVPLQQEVQDPETFM